MRFGSVFMRVALAVMTLALLASGCSKNSSAPAVGGGGPTFDHTFPPSNGNSNAITFTDVGTWGYHCNIHSIMTGTVIVSGPAVADSAVVTIGPGLQFSPGVVTIHPTGYVRWVTSSTTATHTVSR